MPLNGYPPIREQHCGETYKTRVTHTNETHTLTYSNEKENHDGRKVLVIVLRPLISGLELIFKRETGSVLDSACCCLCAEAKAHEPRFSLSPQPSLQVSGGPRTVLSGQVQGQSFAPIMEAATEQQQWWQEGQ